MTLNIMTFNIQHCENFNTKEIDFDFFATAIKNSSADIIGLNEVRDKGERTDYEAQAKILAEKAGYNYYFAKAIDVDDANPYGNAILSKYPIKDAQTVIIKDPITKTGKEHYETRCILKATVKAEKDITVLITHFGLNKDEQTNAVSALLSLITETNCILMGDFNLTPESEIINPIKEAMNDTAENFTSPLLSFPSDKPVKKIDYIFTSKNIKTVNADIPELVVSDHRPVTAQIVL